MTRVLSYNILLGGTGRVAQLRKMIESVNPDVIGLVEATDVRVIKQLASDLGMHIRITGEGLRKRDWQIAVLSRLPIIQSQIHTRPAVLTRQHLLEVQVKGTDGNPLTVFVIHLTAQIYKGKQSNAVRRAEVRELLTIMNSVTSTPHLAMGDFNSLVPGDPFQASKLVRYVLDLEDRSSKKYTQQPFSLRLLKSAVHTLNQTRTGSFLIDKVGPAYAQGGNDLLLDAGYIDCFRQLHPHETGYTFPAPGPATRIDYIFASPQLASQLSACEVVTGLPETRAEDASDHLPIWADFT